MRQAPGVVCSECSAIVPAGHPFCGGCGAESAPEDLELQEEYYGPGQIPGKARLLLIRGAKGVAGHDYMLLQSEHLAGSGKVPIRYTKDKWLSKEHATFEYEDGQLFVSDQGSLNGVFVRITGPATLEPGQAFVCGDHMFTAEITPKDTSAPDVDETYFYASPKATSAFRVVEHVEGGRLGMICCAQGSKLRIGRQDCNMNFPHDLHMSSRHASLSIDNEGAITLTDDRSNNGVFVRTSQRHPLGDGDYLMLGRQLLRVEFTAD